MALNAQWNSAPCGLVIFDDEGRILELNETIRRWLLIPDSAESRPARFSDLLTVAGQVFYQTHLFPLLRLHGHAEEIFITLRSRTGDSVPALAYAVRTDGKTECAVVPVRERQKYEQEILAAKNAAEEAVRSNKELIEARDRLQAQAHELERRIRRAEQTTNELLQVSKVLFHDLREPIRKIDTFSELIRAEADLNDEGKFAVARIENAATRMRQLLEALQQFVSVETDQDGREWVDLTAVVQEVSSRVREKFNDVAAEVTIEDLPRIEGCPRQLPLLFEALITNAFKFRRPEAKLEIRITGAVVEENRFQAVRGHYKYGEYAQIFVADNGKGIPPEFRFSAFELLKKLDPNNSAAGCGLAICKKIVENHYGTICVAGRKRQQHGTTIKILLPVQSETLRYSL